MYKKDLSILIPSRNEMFLENTIENIFANIEGNTEVIAVLDGNWPIDGLEDRRGAGLDPVAGLPHSGLVAPFEEILATLPAGSEHIISNDVGTACSAPQHVELASENLVCEGKGPSVIRGQQVVQKMQIACIISVD